MARKLFAIFTLCVCMLLSACGSNNDAEIQEEQQQEIDKNSSSAYIGKWVYDTGKGNVITFTFEKGGIGKYEQSAKEESYWDFTYEIKEEVIILTRNAIGTTFLGSYELNDDGTKLSYISGDMPSGVYKKVE